MLIIFISRGAADLASVTGHERPRIIRSPFVEWCCVAGFAVSVTLQFLFETDGYSRALENAYLVLWPSSFILMGARGHDLGTLIWILIAIALNVVMYGLVGMILLWLYRMVGTRLGPE